MSVDWPHDDLDEARPSLPATRPEVSDGRAHKPPRGGRPKQRDNPGPTRPGPPARAVRRSHLRSSTWAIPALPSSKALEIAKPRASSMPTMRRGITTRGPRADIEHVLPSEKRVTARRYGATSARRSSHDCPRGEPIADSVRLQLGERWFTGTAELILDRRPCPRVRARWRRGVPVGLPLRGTRASNVGVTRRATGTFSRRRMHSPQAAPAANVTRC